MCATCYTLNRQDQEYFGGLREQVLRPDGYCCPVCGASGREEALERRSLSGPGSFTASPDDLATTNA